jgi:putative hydrolase of the HAD superfamily
LGNVLINFDHKIAAGRAAKFTDKSELEIFNLFFDSSLTASFEEGKISSVQFFSELKKILNLKISFDEFLPIWNEIFFLTEQNRAVYNLACSLKKHYTLVLLSNINETHFAYIKKTFPVLDAFHKIITSFELGLRKPEPLVYSKIIEILNVGASNIFYTDDRQELVESAKILGLKAFVYKGIKQLEGDLKQSGVNIN